jgi:hypothetical protein
MVKTNINNLNKQLKKVEEGVDEKNKRMNNLKANETGYDKNKNDNPIGELPHERSQRLRKEAQDRARKLNKKRDNLNSTNVKGKTKKDPKEEPEVPKESKKPQKKPTTLNEILDSFLYEVASQQKSFEDIKNKYLREYENNVNYVAIFGFISSFEENIKEEAFPEAANRLYKSKNHILDLQKEIKIKKGLQDRKETIYLKNIFDRSDEDEDEDEKEKKNKKTIDFSSIFDISDEPEIEDGEKQKRFRKIRSPTNKDDIKNEVDKIKRELELEPVNVPKLDTTVVARKKTPPPIKPIKVIKYAKTPEKIINDDGTVTYNDIVLDDGELKIKNSYNEFGDIDSDKLKSITLFFLNPQWVEIENASNIKVYYLDYDNNLLPNDELLQINVNDEELYFRKVDREFLKNFSECESMSQNGNFTTLRFFEPEKRPDIRYIIAYVGNTIKESTMEDCLNVKRLNDKINCRPQVKVTQKIILQDLEIFNKMEKYIKERFETFEENFENIFKMKIKRAKKEADRDEDNEDIRNLLKIFLSKGLLECAPNVEEYQPDSDFIKIVINQCFKNISDDNLTIGVVARQVANILAFCDSELSKVDNEIFRQRIMNVYYVPEILPFLTFDEKLPGFETLNQNLTNEEFDNFKNKMRLLESLPEKIENILQAIFDGNNLNIDFLRSEEYKSLLKTINENGILPFDEILIINKAIKNTINEGNAFLETIEPTGPFKSRIGGEKTLYINKKFKKISVSECDIVFQKIMTKNAPHLLFLYTKYFISEKIDLLVNEFIMTVYNYNNPTSTIRNRAKKNARMFDNLELKVDENLRKNFQNIVSTIIPKIKNCKNEDDPFIKKLPNYDIIKYKDENGETWCLSIKNISEQLMKNDFVVNTFNNGLELSKEFLEKFKQTYGNIKVRRGQPLAPNLFKTTLKEIMKIFKNNNLEYFEEEEIFKGQKDLEKEIFQEIQDESDDEESEDEESEDEEIKLSKDEERKDEDDEERKDEDDEERKDEDDEERKDEDDEERKDEERKDEERKDEERKDEDDEERKDEDDEAKLNEAEKIVKEFLAEISQTRDSNEYNIIHDKYVKKYKKNSIFYDYIMEMYEDFKNENIMNEFLSEVSEARDFEDYNTIHNKYSEKYRDNRIVHDFVMKIYAKIKNGDESEDESDDDSFIKQTEKIIDGGQKSPLKKDMKDFSEDITSKHKEKSNISKEKVDSIVEEMKNKFEEEIDDKSDSKLKFKFNHSIESKKSCDECKGKIKDGNLRSKIETSDGLKTVNFCSIDCFEKSDWEE